MPTDPEPDVAAALKTAEELDRRAERATSGPYQVLDHRDTPLKNVQVADVLGNHIAEVHHVRQRNYFGTFTGDYKAADAYDAIGLDNAAFFAACDPNTVRRQNAVLRSLAKRVGELEGIVTLVIGSLRWTGDGYEWTGGEIDYRVKPEEAVRMMAADRARLAADLAATRAERDAAVAAAGEVSKDMESNFSEVELVTSESLIGGWRDRLRQVAGPPAGAPEENDSHDNRE